MEIVSDILAILVVHAFISMAFAIIAAMHAEDKKLSDPQRSRMILLGVFWPIGIVLVVWKVIPDLFRRADLFNRKG